MDISLLDLLICPACLPDERPLHIAPGKGEPQGGDLVTGRLYCGKCQSAYPVENGLAILLPSHARPEAPPDQDKYNSDDVLGAYLWSSFGDLTQEPNASKAYAIWSGMLEKGPGPGLDVGCAVGRSTLELAAAVGFSVGVDLSIPFLRAARQLHREGEIACRLKEQGELWRRYTVTLPPRLRHAKAEFLVADAMALPFRRGAFPSVTALNLMDKLPDPLRHLRELGRVLPASGASLLLADPFSWSEAIAPPHRWIGGVAHGPLAGESEVVLPKVLAKEIDCSALGGGLETPFAVVSHGAVPWTIRNHKNHMEHITSQTFKAAR